MNTLFCGPALILQAATACRTCASLVLLEKIVLGWRALRPPRVVFVIGVASLINSLTSGKTWHPQFVWPESVMATDFLYAGTFNVHWLSLLCTYTCARRFGYPQDTTGILRMPRYPQDASGILRIRYPQDTAVSSGYRVLRIPARVLGYGVPRIPPPILGICRCPQDAPRVPGRQTAFTDDTRHSARSSPRGRVALQLRAGASCSRAGC